MQLSLLTVKRFWIVAMTKDIILSHVSRLILRSWGLCGRGWRRRDDKRELSLRTERSGAWQSRSRSDSGLLRRGRTPRNDGVNHLAMTWGRDCFAEKLAMTGVDLLSLRAHIFCGRGNPWIEGGDGLLRRGRPPRNDRGDCHCEWNEAIYLCLWIASLMFMDCFAERLAMTVGMDCFVEEGLLAMTGEVRLEWCHIFGSCAK